MKGPSAKRPNPTLSPQSPKHEPVSNPEDTDPDQPITLKEYTRLFVSHLPKYVKEDRLSKLFSQYGTITDCKIKRSPLGVSREFAFIGFESHEQAKKAKTALDGTFVDTRKIGVQKALPRGYSDLRGTAWSQWTQGEESFKKNKEKQKVLQSRVKDERRKFFEKFDVFKKSSEDSEFREYMGLKDNKKSWRNDIFENEDPLSQKNAKKQNKSTHNDNSAKPDDGSSTDTKIKSKIAKMSDDDFLNMISGSGANHSDSDSEETESKNQHKNRRKNVNVLDTGRLFIRNIGYSWKEDDIYELFQDYGELTSVHLPIDPTTKTGVGFGFATFMFPEKAQAAMIDLDGTSFKGRILHIIPAENPKKTDLNEVMSRDDLTYKQKLLAKRKSEKENKQTWNALYMRGDTVAETMAEQKGMDKRKFLGDASRTDRMAVRMAKAEAEMVQQTKDSLSTHGVDFSVLNKPENLAKRSKNAILIKNLPHNTQSEELEELFSQYGQLEKVIMPPSRTIALVKFYHNNEAKKAFNKNSFKSFKHIPLFLEWAPQSMLKGKRQSTKETPKTEQNKTDQVVKMDSSKESNPENATLFVSNINFQSTEDDIRELFSTCGSVSNVRLLASKGRGSHRGAGFVTFSSLNHAAKAHEKLQNYVLDNHALVVRYSNVNKGADGDEKNKKVAVVDGKTLTFKKIVVKNIAFQATKKEIYQLFSQFGKIETVRLPEKVAGGHRGFAFVEFVSPEECHTAYESLKHTHLYGRHLVLEYAADDHSLETARKRARENLGLNEAAAQREAKRRRKEMTL